MKHKKILIIEGADQQGKTEVARYMSQRTGYRIKHFGSPKENFNFYADYFVDDYTICDRSYISEIAYSLLDGRPCRVKEVVLLGEWMRERAIVIWVDRHTDFVFEQRDEKYTEGEILEVREIYRTIMPMLPFEPFCVNPSDKSFNTLLSYIADKLLVQDPNVNLDPL